MFDMIDEVIHRYSLHAIGNALFSYFNDPLNAWDGFLFCFETSIYTPPWLFHQKDMNTEMIDTWKGVNTNKSTFWYVLKKYEIIDTWKDMNWNESTFQRVLKKYALNSKNYLMR